MPRPSGRQPDQLREISLERGYTCHAEGAVMVSFGNTKVLCTASVDDDVPRWMRGSGTGWVTAEYSMLPRATDERVRRDRGGKIGGRTQEIQRLIGRSLRAAVDLTALGENSIVIDCDVLRADGGTRTASITGAYVALSGAVKWLQEQGLTQGEPLVRSIAAVSVGIVEDTELLDLAYAEDSRAEVDMNIVMTGDGDFVEVQGTAEGQPYTSSQLQKLLDLAGTGISVLSAEQQKAIAG